MPRGKAKGHAIVNAQKKAKTSFPDFNPLDYDVSVRNNLTHYKENFESKNMKEFALTYWKDQSKNIEGLSKLPQGYFESIGAVCHMLTRNCPLNDEHIKKVDEKRKELLRIASTYQPTTYVAPVKPSIDKETQIKNDTDYHIAEFEFMLDEFITGKKSDPRKYLVGAEVKKPVMVNIADHFKKKMVELNEIDNDEKLQEGYSNFSKKELREFKEFIQSIISACDTASAIIKARKPRTKKVKPPSVIAKDVRYMKEYSNLNLKSVSPEKIIDAKEVWVFNVKLRKLFKYVSLENLTLTVRGTTIIGHDPDKSGGKILRKPEVQLKEYSTMTSRPFNKLYNEIRATTSVATGRLNEDSIILKCF